MKKLSICILLIILVSPAFFAQNNTPVVIRLKNGEILKGTLQTENTTAAVLILNNDKVHTVQWSEVAMLSSKRTYDSLQANKAIELIEHKKTEEEKTSEINQPIMITVTAILAYMIFSIGK